MNEDSSSGLRVRHVYEHDAEDFERNVNAALEEILDAGHVVADLSYASDPATTDNRRGGFGALILYEYRRPPIES